MFHTNKSGLIAVMVLVLAILPGTASSAASSTNVPDLTLAALASATATPSGAAWFGAITFAEDVTDEGLTVKPGIHFASGTTYLYINTPDKSPLIPGKYTLTLSLDGKVARSASFVVGSPRSLGPPARPEDIVDPKLLPYWRKLAGMANPTIRDIAQLVPSFHIPMRIENLSGWGAAVYRFDPTRCDKPGQVIVLTTAFNGKFDDTVALIAHELTHAQESLLQAKPCTCTIDNEFWAYIVQIYVLQELGHQDWIRNSWGNPYDANGHFSQARLYKWIREHYVCPEH
jgi:hypothetical protein